MFGCEGGGGGVNQVKTAEMNHLWLMLGCGGGGSGGSHVETMTVTMSSSHFDAREVVVVAAWV